MSVISVSQKEDYRTMVRKHGYAESDFELEESEATRAMVAITRKRCSVCKIYPAGHDADWLTEFADDLSRGVFGPNLPPQ
jgi:hypothetical protein